MVLSYLAQLLNLLNFKHVVPGPCTMYTDPVSKHAVLVLGPCTIMYNILYRNTLCLVVVQCLKSCIETRCTWSMYYVFNTCTMYTNPV